MANIHVVTKERHGNKRWQRYSSYAHAATDAVARLVLPEISRACVAMPVGFLKHNGDFVPVAVQGLAPGRNVFVDAVDGRWLADYIPAIYRAHPFTLAAEDGGPPVLCVDEDSDLISDGAGTPFFDDHDELTSALKDVLDFMTGAVSQRKGTQHVCNVLEKHKLVQSWPIGRPATAQEQIIRGLYRIDKAALKQLPVDAFQEVRLAGALPVIYCHLLSMQHLPKLSQLAQTPTAGLSAAPLARAGDLDLAFLNNDGSVNFYGLGHSDKRFDEVSL